MHNISNHVQEFLFDCLNRKKYLNILPISLFLTAISQFLKPDINVGKIRQNTVNMMLRYTFTLCRSVGFQLFIDAKNFRFISISLGYISAATFISEVVEKSQKHLIFFKDILVGDRSFIIGAIDIITYLMYY